MKEYYYDECTTFAVKWQTEYSGLEDIEVLKVKKYNWELEFSSKEWSIFLKEEPKRKFKLTVITRRLINT